MATATRLDSHHTLSLHLAAGYVDVALGIVRECTVAKANVQAQGKFVLLDKSGAITRDESLAVTELPVFTDDKFLQTLMSAAEEAGPRVKAREDHDDAIGARAGYFDAFRKTDDGRVVADMNLFAAYRNRSVVIETAAKTPEEIGLSIDFIPEFEIQGDRALMRVQKLIAVDIVDEGAITPGGLFLSAGVDTDEKKQTATAEKHSPHQMPSSNEDLMNAITTMGKTMTEAIASLASVVSKNATASASPAADGEALKAVKVEQERMAAELKSQNERLALVTADNAKLKKERALLGFRGTQEERAALESKSPEDIEKLAAEKKSYLQLVDAHQAAVKCKRSEAHIFVMKNHRAEHEAHLKAKGVIRNAA